MAADHEAAMAKLKTIDAQSKGARAAEEAVGAREAALATAERSLAELRARLRQREANVTASEISLQSDVDAFNRQKTSQFAQWEARMAELSEKEAKVARTSEAAAAQLRQRESEMVARRSYVEFEIKSREEELTARETRVQRAQSSFEDKCAEVQKTIAAREKSLEDKENAFLGTIRELQQTVAVAKAQNGPLQELSLNLNQRVNELEGEATWWKRRFLKRHRQHIVVCPSCQTENSADLQACKMCRCDLR